MLVEALSKVRKGKLGDCYGNQFVKIAVFRPKDLSVGEKKAIVQKANSYVGRKYGYIKIIAHWLAWFLLGAYFFRRFTKMDKYPICSFLVAKSYAEGGKFFGMHPGQAQPVDHGAGGPPSYHHHHRRRRHHIACWAVVVGNARRAVVVSVAFCLLVLLLPTFP